MQQFKRFYLITCWLLFLAQLVILFAWAYTSVFVGKVPYYGDPEDKNPVQEKYFQSLEILLYTTFIMIILWCFLTPFAVIANKRSLESNKINIGGGSVGFILAILLLIIDPFGIFKWFTG